MMSLGRFSSTRRLRRIFAVVAASAGLLATAPLARAHHSATLDADLTTIMSAAGAAEFGFLVQEVGGPTIAQRNASDAFQTASTLKVLVALHALQQVQAGAADLDDAVSQYGISGSCPFITASSGTDTLETAIQLMMRVSDNARTHALVMHFGVDAVNATATAAGLTDTRFQTMNDSPGYHMLGCVRDDHTALNPPRVEGNTTALDELAAIYGGVADGTLLQGEARDDFSRLTTGRQMFEEEGYDFFGYWPEIVAIAGEERPAEVTDHEFDRFLSRVDDHAKGGYYSTNSPALRWTSFSGIVEVPTCTAGTVVDRTYSLGMFFERVPAADEPALTTAFVDARKAMARTLLSDALDGWSACATPATLDVIDANVAYDGGPHGVAVATDPVGVPVKVTYTDAGGNAVAAPTDAGTYNVLATVADPTEYTAAPASGTLTITQAPLTVAGPNVTRLYGAENPALVPEITGLVGDDTAADIGPVTCASTATATSPAGTYPVSCSGVTSGNYLVEYVAGTLVVTYDVGAFQRPIADPAGAEPTRVRRGATVPVKFALLGDGGAQLPATIAVERSSACGVLIAIVPAGGPAPSTGTCAGYQPVGSEFHTNLATRHLTPGDHVLYAWVIAADGTPAGLRSVPITIT